MLGVCASSSGPRCCTCLSVFALSQIYRTALCQKRSDRWCLSSLSPALPPWSQGWTGLGSAPRMGLWSVARCWLTAGCSSLEVVLTRSQGYDVAWRSSTKCQPSAWLVVPAICLACCASLASSGAIRKYFVRAVGFRVMPTNLPETFIDRLTCSRALSVPTEQKGTPGFLFATQLRCWNSWYISGPQNQP